MKIKMSNKMPVKKKCILLQLLNTDGQCVSGTAVLDDCELTVIQFCRNYTSIKKNIFASV